MDIGTTLLGGQSHKVGFDFGRTNPGDVVMVVTGNSTWFFTRTSRSTVKRDTVIGVLIQTNSRRFNQGRGSNPQLVEIDRLFYRGEEIFMGNGHTGTVRQVFVNGELVNL